MNNNDIEKIKTFSQDELSQFAQKVLSNSNVDVNTYASGNAPTEEANLTTGGVTTYTDLTGKQVEAANYVADKGYMVGTSDTSFNPDGKVTRAQMAQVLYSMAGKPAVSGSSQFSDVTNTAWYSNATTWAQQNGIIAGYEDGTFRPNEELTNEQALAMLRQYGTYRELDTTAYIPSTEMARDYSDYSSVSDWAKDSMSWAVDNWLVQGSSLNPQGAVSRIDLANYIKNFETTYANDLGLSNKLNIVPINDVGGSSQASPTPSGISASVTAIPSGPGTPPASTVANLDEILNNPNSTSNTSQTVTTKYSDVKAADAEAVNYVSERGLMVGTSNTTFNPDAGITRGQIVQILYAMSGSPSNVGGKTSFSDVNSNDWYANAVAWAQNTQLVAGYDDGTFRPNQVISKEQAAAILKRYAEQSGEDLTTYKAISNPVDYNTLKGTDQVSNYAQDAVRWAVADGMIDTSSGSIDPKGNLTRAEFAKYLMTYDKNYNNGTGKGKYNITPIQNPGLSTSSVGTTSAASTPTKSVSEVAAEVINGAWGNGDERRQRLEAAGYDYSAVQAEVNRLFASEGGSGSGGSGGSSEDSGGTSAGRKYTDEQLKSFVDAGHARRTQADVKKPQTIPGVSGTVKSNGQNVRSVTYGLPPY